MTKKLLIASVVVVLALILIANFLVPKGGTAIVVGIKDDLAKMLKDKTVLPRAKLELKNAIAARDNAEEMAKRLRIDVKVSERQVERIQEEIAKSREAFITLQDSAKENGLPKRAEATAEDREKTIFIAGAQRTGAEVYRSLQQLKDELQRAERTIDREKIGVRFKNKRLDILTEHDTVIANKIADLEMLIADYEAFKSLLDIHQSLAKVDLPTDTMERVLNANGIFAEIQTEVDKIETILQDTDSRKLTDDIKRDIVAEKSSFTITEDDLL